MKSGAASSCLSKIKTKIIEKIIIYVTICLFSGTQISDTNVYVFSKKLILDL